jgi:hypothetical protein
VSESLYIVTGNFYNVVYGGFASGSGIPYTGVIDGARRTLADMGKKIIVGSSDNSVMIEFTKVRVPAPSSVGGLGGLVGFIATENTCSDIPDTDGGRFAVRVARV